MKIADWPRPILRAPTYAEHRARAIDGVSRWRITKPRRRVIELQDYKGKLLLHGAVVQRRDGNLSYMYKFEVPIETINVGGTWVPA